MSAPIYHVSTEAEVAGAAAATKKTIVGVKAHANSGIQLVQFWVSCNGVTASEVPILVELDYCTWATNSPGTNSTSSTVRQRNGRVLTAGFTGGYAWTTQPTVLTLLQPFYLDPNKGLLIYDFPLGSEPDSALGEGLTLSCTIPTGGAAVKFEGGMAVTRI